MWCYSPGPGCGCAGQPSDRQAQRSLAQVPQPASAPVAVAPRREIETAPPEVTSMPVEIADEVKPGAAAPAGTVTAVRRLLADLEDLKVTLADGPPALVERLLTTAAAEVWRGSADREAAWDAPGRREVILVGFDGHGDADDPAQPGGEIIRRESVGAALDLIASRTVTARRGLDADLGLTLLVSRDRPGPGRAIPADRPSRRTGPGSRSAPGARLARASPQAGQGQHRQGQRGQGQPRRHRIRPGNRHRDRSGTGSSASRLNPPANSSFRSRRPSRCRPSRCRSSRCRSSRCRSSRCRPVAVAPAASLRIGMLGQLTINGQPGALLPAQTQLIVALAVNGPSRLV